MTTKYRTTGIAVHWMRLTMTALLAAGWHGAAALPAYAQGAGKPVAVVGGEPIFEKDYQPQVRTQVYKMQLQEFTVRKKALDEVINNKLLKAEADRLGINEDELLKREADSKIKPPTDEEVEDNFVQLM